MCPGFEVAVVRTGDPQIGFEFLVDVLETRGNGDAFLDGECQPICLSRAVVRVLSEDQHPSVGVWGEVQCTEDVAMLWVHGVRCSFGRNECLELGPIGGIELASQDRIPVGSNSHRNES